MEDAVNEEETILCCAVCCTNCSIYPALDALGASGKIGLCCCQCEFCCKPGAPCLIPFGVVGVKCENDGCSVLNAQCHRTLTRLASWSHTHDSHESFCCVVVSAAIPCNEEVPVAVSIAGLTLYPKMGCCIKQASLKMDR
eukprot:scaffold7101_cov153-Amphora_coffeaeformis.AAC.7